MKEKMIGLYFTQMNKEPKLSVIIPAFNEEKNIELCLKTILEQTYPNCEVIVIDDGSTDQTKEIIKKFPVVLLEQQHKGPAKARNLGAKKATGEILVFMDSDMSFTPTFLEDLVSLIIKGEYRGTFSKEEYISNWSNLWSRCWNYNQNWPKQKMIPDDYPDEGLDFRAILKDEFLKVGGFDDVGYTDTWSLAKKLGYKPHAAKGAKYFHSNPDNLPEVFSQSKWSAKRKYKFGIVGILVALIRNFLLISLVIGIYKSIKYREVAFIPFKIVYDLGAFFGIIQMSLGGKLSK